MRFDTHLCVFIFFLFLRETYLFVCTGLTVCVPGYRRVCEERPVCFKLDRRKGEKKNQKTAEM